MLDTFKTISNPSEEILFKEKNSKFYGYAFPLFSDDEVKPIIDLLRKKHPNAGHFCYAFQIGTDKIQFRTNDDGEPNNSAGSPIYGQILSFGLTNILVVVVRIFGGTKLGVGGLISAYKTGAQMAIEGSNVVEKTINVHYRVSFDYKHMNKVMRVIKEQNLEIISQKLENFCEIEIATRKKNAEKIVRIFEGLFEVTLQLMD